MRDKKLVGVFQYEQYEKQDGTKALKVRLTKFRSLDKLGKIEVSDSVKMLDGTYKSYDDYMEFVENKANEIFGKDQQWPTSILIKKIRTCKRVLFLYKKSIDFCIEKVYY